jgi:hypothetical protein
LKVLVDDALIKEALGNSKYDFSLEERITRPGIAIVSIIILINSLLGLSLYRSWRKSFIN